MSYAQLHREAYFHGEDWITHVRVSRMEGVPTAGRTELLFTDKESGRVFSFEMPLGDLEGLFHAISKVFGKEK